MQASPECALSLVYNTLTNFQCFVRDMSAKWTSQPNMEVLCAVRNITWCVVTKLKPGGKACRTFGHVKLGNVHSARLFIWTLSWVAGMHEKRLMNCKSLDNKAVTSRPFPIKHYPSAPDTDAERLLHTCTWHFHAEFIKGHLPDNNK